ncbi:GGDEF domain-containing protein [Aidingimonas halophila]|uniref:diguanylate cyclase n=1 Tax=Aidingimonas halophila TaxID=574349 RepID=A0A1H3D8C8_9GAMM|nr:GGDEF domain-containing protein [Aidingimonas halophila]GHC30340.1 diguanylate cyclase [Aidingimonas halophila]SDX62772.1 diguanylate cyclase (GGDEF) domain-containing protein [Aidingimonas halophila]
MTEPPVKAGNMAVRHCVQCRRVLAPLWLSLLSALSLGAPVANAQAPRDDLEPVSLQLLWYHQFQSAGYYAAQDQGYYRDAGFDVEIRHGGYDNQGRSVDPVEEVIFGRADFGVTRSDILLHHSRGAPVTVIANIMQRSPLTLLTLKRYGFDRLEDIGDRPVSLTLPTNNPDKRISAETVAALRKADVDIRALNNSPPSWDLDDLLSGTTQLTTAYRTDEPYLLRQVGATPVEIDPADYGVDFYGDTLFTHRQLADNEPERVAAFRDASLRGWEYALEHPEAIATLIEREYGTRSERHDREFLLHEAEQLRELMQPQLIEIGYMNPRRWESIAEVYQELGMIQQADIGSLLFTPESNGSPHLGRWLVPVGTVLALVLLAAGYLHVVNRHLTLEIARRRQAENALRVQAEKDGLTGIDNRRLFEAHIQREFQRARRHNLPLSLILFDIDNFKAINDDYGHLVGDRVLKAIPEATAPVLRSSDLFSRYGGEEFVVILPETPLDEACQVAERIRCVNGDHRIDGDVPNDPVTYTLSLGIAELQADDASAEDLVRRADTELYRAKTAGRNRLSSRMTP